MKTTKELEKEIEELKREVAELRAKVLTQPTYPTPLPSPYNPTWYTITGSAPTTTLPTTGYCHATAHSP